MTPTTSLVVALGLLAAAGQVQAQTPAPASADTPSIRVGVVIYPDYTFTLNPEAVDADGNAYHPNSFNVTRSYINVTGNISRLVGFRVTPDIVRETSAFSSNTGSLEFRIKYAYLQVNLDDWMPAGSYARFGIQQTPWLDFAENIYRYRFQGTMFVEREGFFASADAGASLHYAMPKDRGDIHVGVFNGENYNRAEANGLKSLQVRATVRPFADAPGPSALHGIRASIFYDADRYVKDGPRNRLIAAVSLEHRVLNAGFEFLDTQDRTSIRNPEVDGRGFSVWATPKLTRGIEALLRYDRLRPDEAFGSRTRDRTIAGLAYWFPHQGAVSSAILVDYDGQTFRNVAPAQPRQSRVGVHGLVSF